MIAPDLVACNSLGGELRAIIVNTYDIVGGAARAANRLHNALRRNGFDSSMIVMHKASSDQTVHKIKAVPTDHLVNYQYILSDLIQKYYIDSSRTELSNTLFSFAYPGYDISAHSGIQNADIVNIHWASFFQSPTTLAKLMHLGRPVVWTLHDMCPFTGGCHYSAGCEGYVDDCISCPQLSEDPYLIPQAVLSDKRELFAGAPLTIVTPSSWLADCARRSSLFRYCRIEVIRNSVETDLYRAAPKQDAKKRFNIEPDSVVLMFGADSSNEMRKGFTKLETALMRAKAHPLFRDVLKDKGITILSLGPLTTDMSKLGLPVKALGHLNDDALISLAYSAADIFVLPSLEDNLPNMMLESMACGTPVLAFATGGIPDVVQDGINGRLVPSGDVNSLADCLVELVCSAEMREHLSAEATRNAQDWFAQKVQADKYISLFEDLCGKKSAANALKKLPCVDEATLDVGCGPHFDRISHKVMLDTLLRAVPDICEQQRAASLSELIARVNTLDLAIQDRDAALTAQQKRLEQIESSLSWRLTAPLRKIGDWIRRFEARG